MADRHKNSDDDDNSTRSVLDFLMNEARTGYIETQCKEYFDNRTFRHKICFDSGEYSDILELYAPNGSFTIQKLLDEHQDIDIILLRRPAPDILPILVSKIFNDINSFILPTETLSIHKILPRSRNYQLEAIICEINQRQIIFMKNISTGDWYYYQKDQKCEQLSKDLSVNLNTIIRTRPLSEQIRLIGSAHFLVSMVFYNALKYIYKQEDD